MNRVLESVTLTLQLPCSHRMGNTANNLKVARTPRAYYKSLHKIEIPVFSPRLPTKASEEKKSLGLAGRPLALVPHDRTVICFEPPKRGPCRLFPRPSLILVSLAIE